MVLVTAMLVVACDGTCRSDISVDRERLWKKRNSRSVRSSKKDNSDLAPHIHVWEVMVFKRMVMVLESNGYGVKEERLWC
jgi:hypothetical protein